MPQMVLLFLVFFGTTRVGLGPSGETASVIVFVLWGTAEMSDLEGRADLHPEAPV